MDQKKVHISPDQSANLGLAATEIASSHSIVSNPPGKRLSLYLVLNPVRRK